MKIDEKIQEIQGKLIKVLTEASFRSKEETIRLLEEVGLEKSYAAELLEAFVNEEKAKNTAKNVWNTDLEDQPEIDYYSTDIAKYQQQELEKRQYFDTISAKCALLIVARRIEPSQIDDEILGKLHEAGIQEHEIINPELRITFHYYSESRAKDIQRDAELDKLRQYSVIIGEKISTLEEQLRQTQNQNTALKRAYRSLRKKFIDRIASDEKHYQEALSQISTLRKKLNRLQEKSVFQVMGARLKETFGKKTNELPEPTVELPYTLYESISEKIRIEAYGVNEEKATSNQKQTPSTERTDNYDERQ